MTDDVTTRQHYVPSFYLSNFANPQSNELEVLDLENKQILDSKGPKGLCYEDFFYAAQTGEEDEISQDVEDLFQIIESRLGNYLIDFERKALNNKKINNKTKYGIASMMSSFWIRGASFRQWMNKQNEELLKTMYKMRLRHNPDKFFEKMEDVTGKSMTEEEKSHMEDFIEEERYDVEFSNQHHLKFLAEMEGFANLFFHQRWEVFISRNERNFVTSCNPVVVKVPERKTFYGPTFLERTHIFALTPQILIKSMPPTKMSGKKIFRRNLYSDKSQTVKDFNVEIANQSRGLIFAPTEQELNALLDFDKTFKKKRESLLQSIIENPS